MYICEIECVWIVDEFLALIRFHIKIDEVWPKTIWFLSNFNLFNLFAISFHWTSHKMYLQTSVNHVSILMGNQFT